MPDVERGGIAEAGAGAVHVVNLETEMVHTRDDGSLRADVGAKDGDEVLGLDGGDGGVAIGG